MRYLPSIAYAAYGILALLQISGCHQKTETHANAKPDKTMLLKRVTEPETEITAKVNGIVIDAEQLNQLYAHNVLSASLADGKIPAVIGLNTKLAITQKLIDSELLRQAAAEKQLSISVDAIQKGVKQFAASFSSDEDYQTYLAKQVNGIASIEKQIFNQFVIDQFIDLLIVKEISDDEAQNFYEQYVKPLEDATAGHINFSEIKDKVKTTMVKLQKIALQDAFVRKLRSQSNITNAIAERYASLQDTETFPLDYAVIASDYTASGSIGTKLPTEAGISPNN